MKKLKIIAMSLCMVLLCSFSLTFVGCGNDNDSTNSTETESEMSEADAYAYELLSKYDYDVDYTYTVNGGETYYHTYVDSVEYIHYYGGEKTTTDLNGNVTATEDIYYTTAFDYSGNHPKMYVYDELEETYTTTTYSGTSAEGYMEEKASILSTADGALIGFLYLIDLSDLDSYTNLTSTKSTKNNVTTLTKTFNTSIGGETVKIELTLTIENGQVTEFETLECNNAGEIQNQTLIVYTYEEVSFDVTQFSEYTLAS